MRNVQDFNQIKAERDRAGLTLAALSEKTGIPVSTLGRYQHSEYVPMSAAQKIADALGIPVTALMSPREIPEEDRLTYDQVYLQLQSTQQRNVYLAVICDRLRQSTRLLRIIAVILGLFLLYILVDRFGFPSAGIFHAG